MRKILAFSFVAAAMLSACTGLSDSEQETLAGSDMILRSRTGAIGGSAGLGLAAGSVVGPSAAYMYDQQLKSRQRTYRAALAAEEARAAAAGPRPRTP
jgi:hypothetical protein